MFCPNCGNKVPENSNFCPTCGKNLKDVKISIKSNDNVVDKKEQKNSNTNSETQVFQPINRLDSINNTNEISDIIKAVDERISENIHKYETGSYTKEDFNAAAEKEHKKQVVKEKKSSTKENQKNNPQPVKGNKKTKDNNPKKSDLNIENKNEEKKKFNIKSMWNNFINEGDDEFSVFASIEEEPETKENKIELSNSTNSDEIISVSTDTMGISKAAVEKKLKEFENNPTNNKQQVKKESNLKTNKTEPVKEKTISQKKENTNTSKKSIEKNMTKTVEPKEKLSHKSFTDQVNKELEKIEADKNNQKPIESDKKKNIDIEIKENENTKTSPNKNFFKSVSSKFSKKETPKKLKKEKNPEKEITLNKNGFYNFMDKVVDLLEKLNSLIISKGKNSFITTSIIGVILSLLPIIIASKKISFSVIILLLFKLLFNILEFYIPLNITTEKVWVESSEEEVKYFAFVNWFICQVFLFVAFMLSPWNGLFTFKLLPALTPLPIATIVMFLIAIIVSLAQYWSQLKNENKVNFIGWYLIPFLLIHFISKLFFAFANLIV